MPLVTYQNAKKSEGNFGFDTPLPKKISVSNRGPASPNGGVIHRLYICDIPKKLVYLLIVNI